MKDPPIFTIAVEGNIGSGKSEFIKRFQNIDNIDILLEPIEKWTDLYGHNLLHMMYNDPSRYFALFQQYAFLTQMEQHAIINNPIKMMERSVYSARYCFVENLKISDFHNTEYHVLIAWFDFIKKHLNSMLNVDLIIYLQTTPEIAYSRLKQRQRVEEHNIEFEHIKDLHNLHENWLVQEQFPRPSPVLILNANKDFKDMVYDVECLKQKIFKLASEKR